MKCKICNNKVNFIGNFKPYIDLEWIFKLYYCNKCNTKFTLRNNIDNYYDILYKESSLYKYKYYYADKIKKYIKNSEINKCKNLILKCNVLKSVYYHINNNLNKKSKILEVGCGTGYNVGFLRSLGYNVKGTDISKESINYAIKNFGENFSLNVENSSRYDFIYCSGVVSCVNDPVNFINNYLLLLKKGGTLLFNLSNIDSLKDTKDIWVSTPPPDTIFIFSEETLKYFNINKNKFNLKYKIFNDPSFIKNLLFYKKMVFNNYPINFKKNIGIGDFSFKNLIFTILKPFIKFITFILIKLHIFKNFKNEYGIIVQINKI